MAGYPAEDTGRKVPYHNTTRHHNPEDLDLYYQRDNNKSLIKPYNCFHNILHVCDIRGFSGIAIGYRLDDRGLSAGRGREFLSSPPLPDLLSLLSNGYQGLFPCGKAAGA
jgi:hypothetical protein